MIGERATKFKRGEHVYIKGNDRRLRVIGYKDVDGRVQYILHDSIAYIFNEIYTFYEFEENIYTQKLIPDVDAKYKVGQMVSIKGSDTRMRIISYNMVDSKVEYMLLRGVNPDKTGDYIMEFEENLYISN